VIIAQTNFQIRTPRLYNGTARDGDILTLTNRTGNAGDIDYFTPVYNSMPALTLVANPTAGTANAIPIGLVPPLGMVGTNLTVGSQGAVTTTTDYTVAAGVTCVLADATSGNITITLPPASREQEVTIIKKDNVANIVTVISDGTSGDSFATGIGPIRLFLRQEFVKVRGIGSNLNSIVGSVSSDLGTIGDMRNYSMAFRTEFADTTVASFWGQNGLSTASYTADPSHMFISTLTTGAATNGMGYIALRNLSVQLNTANPMVLTFDFMIPNGGLPTVTEYYIIECGIGVTVSPTGTDLSDTDCVLFRYASQENGGKFRLRVCANGAGNSVYVNDSAITPAVDTWYRVTLLMSSSRVWMLVNDTLVGPATTGIPTAGTMTVMFRMEKGIGTTPKLINLDYFKSARTAIR